MKTSRSVSRYIVQLSTGCYWKNPFGWTAKIADATSFPDFASIYRICNEQHLRNVEVLLHSDALWVDLRLPLQNGQQSIVH